MVAVVTPFVFDTLSASKQLREAGMSEGVAEAVVSVFQHAAATPDISHLATRDDVAADIEALRREMKAEFAAVRSEMKAEFAAVRSEMRAESATLRAELNDKLRQQMWTFLGGVGVLLTISTAMTRVLAG
jgi:hypothetical protein